MIRIIIYSFIATFLTACAVTKPFDYTNYRANRPRSILVLPPINQTTNVDGTYGYYSTVTQPIAERGYYIFPISLVDQFLKENGMPGSGEMHEIPLEKAKTIFGADSILYITLTDYGTKYQVVNSETRVAAKGKLVDTKNGLLLWEGETAVVPDSSGGSDIATLLVKAIVNQIISSSTDLSHKLSPKANDILVKEGGGHGLLYGPFHPLYGSD